jgi:hypothetical protein
MMHCERCLSLAADALREAIGAPVPLGDRPRQTRAFAALRSALGPERLAVAWEAARSSNPDNPRRWAAPTNPF